MKNHILALQVLVQKNEMEEADNYLQSMQSFMANPQEYVATGNDTVDSLLDNAIRACLQTEEKKLKITMKLDKGVLFLNICNSCLGIIKGKRNMLETTKYDKTNHGIGLKNVQRIVEKYHGDMEFLCENGSMEVDIMLYIRDM
jgi:sensor histidine kinase regulating citrate/malate metabolism